ncbi:hypothetical protein CMV_012077 [Castanea mollissima]|uniref:Uncharacterized protein n=1 Tax=Castanea mollissima TaxID=60419 RepID=A0A8J4VWF9_9ROSI|nr:hypothetical protein CMV_012077 [Castanea mollissima]
MGQCYKWLGVPCHAFECKEQHLRLCDGLRSVISMCSGSKWKRSYSSMEEEFHDIDEASLWYRRRIGSKMMGFKQKTTLMIATMFESKGVLNYILETSFVDVNQASGLDRLLHFILFLLWTSLYKLATICKDAVLYEQKWYQSVRMDKRDGEAHFAASRSTQREEGSKREITVIMACTVEEDREVVMDLGQMDEQETPGCQQEKKGRLVKTSHILGNFSFTDYSEICWSCCHEYCVQEIEKET